MTRETRKRELEIGIGLVLYLLAFLISMQAKMKSKAEMLLFLLPYIVSAISIYKEQAEKFLKKQFLDENLLMIIATVGAFFVGRYKEAVAAMLFYQVGKLVEEISLSRTKKSIAKCEPENRKHRKDCSAAGAEFETDDRTASGRQDPG